MPKKIDRRILNKRIRDLQAEVDWYRDMYGPHPPEQPFNKKRTRTMSPSARAALMKARHMRRPQQRDPVTNRFIASGIASAEQQTAGATLESMDAVSTD